MTKRKSYSPPERLMPLAWQRNAPPAEPRPPHRPELIHPPAAPAPGTTDAIIEDAVRQAHPRAARSLHPYLRPLLGPGSESLLDRAMRDA